MKKDKQLIANCKIKKGQKVKFTEETIQSFYNMMNDEKQIALFTKEILEKVYNAKLKEYIVESIYVSMDIVFVNLLGQKTPSLPNQLIVIE